MANTKPGSLENWRNYFRTADSDIFGIIDHAIVVAALDCPKELKLRRDRIAERLFTAGLGKCSGCDRVSSDDADADCDDYVDVVGIDDDDDDIAGEVRERRGGGGFSDALAGASKESKVNSSSRDDDDELEALTEEIEEESRIVGEVFRIKGILQNSEEQSDSVLFDSLRRLQLMGLTVDTLKATEIGKTVNRFRKHGSKDISNLARSLIDGWKDLVDEWVNASAAIAAMNCTEGTPDSVNPSVLDEEEGLPSPPLDDLVFFGTQPTSMELTGFFDGMDDDGNPRNVGESGKSHKSGRRPSSEDRNVSKRKPNAPTEMSELKKESRNQQIIRKHEGAPRPTNNKPSNNNAASGPGRPPRVGIEPQSNGSDLHKRAVPHPPQNKPKISNNDAVQDKLEATKRKLQERYQQAENAKRQRTIQVMEIRDLPKQNTGHRNPNVKPGNYNNRNWAHGRR